jgi:hypothetical protein
MSFRRSEDPPEEGACGNATVLEITTQQANALWSGNQQHRAFSLPFAEHTDLLIVLG